MANHNTTNDKLAQISEYRWERKCEADVAEILADINARAAKGEIATIAIAFVAPNGSGGARFSRSPNIFALSGAVAMLARMIMDKVMSE